MSNTSLDANALSESLDQARVTIDYLIEDVVRLKERAQALEEENQKLKETLDEIYTTHAAIGNAFPI